MLWSNERDGSMGCKASRSRILPTHVSYTISRDRKKHYKNNNIDEKEEEQEMEEQSAEQNINQLLSAPAFTELQVDIVKSTWPLIEDNLAKHGMEMFRHIFHMEPEAKQLFEFRWVKHLFWIITSDKRLLAHTIIETGNYINLFMTH